MRVDLEQTRHDIRCMFGRWGLDPSEWEIVYQEKRLANGVVEKMPGATVRYMRKDGKWQTVSSFTGHSRGDNLRKIFFFLDRLRIAEKQGVQYQGLSFTKEVATTGSNGSAERERKEDTLDAYDAIGCAPDDPVDLVKDIYKKKAMRYHPDAGGDQERFKRLQTAYELVMKSRGQQP